FGLLDNVIEAQAELGPFAVAEPANPGGQTLEPHLVAGQFDPAGQSGVFRKEIEDGLIGPIDVLLLPRQGDPAKRSLALAEQWANVFGNATAHHHTIL